MARKILFVEDHALLRESLLWWMARRLPDLAWREAGTLAQAQALLAAEPQTDLVLLDLDLPDSRGLATLARLRRAAPEVPVAVLSAHDEPQQVLAAIDQGASGFLPKTTDAEQLAQALLHMVNGGVVVPREVSAAAPAAPAMADAGLSERQRDVLRLLVEGRSNKAIGRALDLSETTVKTHLQAVFRKLEVSNRTQAVLAAARLGLVLRASQPAAAAR